MTLNKIMVISPYPKNKDRLLEMLEERFQPVARNYFRLATWKVIKSTFGFGRIIGIHLI